MSIAEFARQFNFALTIRDSYHNNSPIGQAEVFLEVGNATVVHEAADDYGQINFSVPSSHLGKRGRLYVKARNYHPADVSIDLQGDYRNVISLVPDDFPKLDADPPAPGPVGSPPEPPPPPPDIPIILRGETKSGQIADDQTINFRFDAFDNVPLIFTAQTDDRVTFYVHLFSAEGFPLNKSMRIGRGDHESLAFTPPETGTYILRLKGDFNYGGFLISMNNMND